MFCVDLVYCCLEVFNEVWVLVGSSVEVYNRVNRVVFLFGGVYLDDYCRYFWGCYVKDAAVYVVFHVNCNVGLVYCCVALDWEAVFGCCVGEVVIRKCDGRWCVFVVS